MSAQSIWEVRVYGRLDRGSAEGHRAMRVHRVYSVVEESFTDASRHAKQLALLDGVRTPVVWSATRLCDAPVRPVAYLTGGRER